MDVTSVFKKFIKTFLPQTTARGYSQQRILPDPVLHFTSPSVTPHEEHHQHKEKATGAKELTPASKIFIMSLSEKSHNHQAAEASAETEAEVAQQTDRQTDRQTGLQEIIEFFFPATNQPLTHSFFPVTTLATSRQRWAFSLWQFRFNYYNPYVFTTPRTLTVDNVQPANQTQPFFSYPEPTK
jgi:hypothetical protein